MPNWLMWVCICLRRGPPFKSYVKVFVVFLSFPALRITSYTGSIYYSFYIRYQFILLAHRMRAEFHHANTV
ncbi:hypothetical protein BDV33DRAFT_179300 [Aspergillus novoparasiticus]|uniref:Uncharacterized protein n=1 Tax=Aspergillus novoparasiticus TaxID=986946 RepID=A0A5N6EG71_9EURO|nr:hypothetical protein BDV33DRAFT_179300 [Aspergillus novoparasiticus]